MISTSDLASISPRATLQQVCKATSVLDAILSQEWVNRYFSYQSEWAEYEEFFEMRDGQGDHMLISFREECCVINGMAHEYYPKDKEKLTSGLPKIFSEFIFGEPVRSIGTTFCLWTTDNVNWQTGEINDFNDGSSQMLWIFDGKPQTYIDWATDYYEDDFFIGGNASTVVSDIYAGKALTEEMVLAITKNLEDWQQLKNDLEEINYPYQFD